MTIEELPEPIQNFIFNTSTLRHEPIGTYHVTEVLHCLVKAQLQHWFHEYYTEHEIPLAQFASWPLFRGNLFHEAFTGVMGGDYNMRTSWTTWEPDGETVTLLGTNDWLEVRDDVLHLGELKTVKNRWWYLKHGPGEEHIKQAAIYIHMLREQQTMLSRASFYYADMEDISYIPHTYTDEEISDSVSEAMSNADRLHAAYRQNRVVDARRDWKKSWECNPKYCKFTEWCHKDFPLEPPDEKSDAKEWWAGAMKTNWLDIDNLADPAFVDEVLADRGIALPKWREVVTANDETGEA